MRILAQTYLTELILSHFRCFRSLRLETDSRPVILTGVNGSGKTSILEAVSLFSPGRGLRRARAEEMARRPGGVGWKVSCRMIRGESERVISSWWRNSPGRRLEVDGRSARQAGLGHCLSILWLTPSMDRIWSEGADGRRRFLDRTAMSLFPDHAAHAVAYDRAMRERNRLLRDGNRDAGWLNALESRMSDSGAELTRGRLRAIKRLETAFAGGESAFPAAGLRLASPGGACAVSTEADELAKSLCSGRQRDFRAGRTLTGPHRADLAVEFRSRGTAAKLCSTGEQKALLISLILANARAISDDLSFPPVLLLDEIAAHLDSSRLRLLLAEVRRLHAQIWMTGTEAALFDEISDDVQNLRIVTGSDGPAVEKISS